MRDRFHDTGLLCIREILKRYEYSSPENMRLRVTISSSLPFGGVLVGQLLITGPHLALVHA